MSRTDSPNRFQATTLRSLLEKYGSTLWPKENHHRRNVFSFILEADEILLGRRFETFTEQDLTTLHEALRVKGNSVATINRKTMALSKLLRFARKSGDVSDVPEFRQLEEPQERIRYLTAKEEEFLFRRLALISNEYHDLSVFLVDTGAKVGEAIGLEWGHISLPERTICLSRGKPVERSIPITSRVSDILENADRGRPGPFSTIEQHKYRAAWNEAKREAGFGDEDGIVPYILRHTCASRLVIGGVDLRRVQLWLGHRTIRMTQKYDYLSTSNLDICVSVLEAAR